MKKHPPLLSVITVCYQSRSTIEDAVISVQKQDYSSYEHIIIDGNSTDGTIELLEKIQHPKLKVFSERDQGIYDAMNKGISRSQGDMICFLNSDDYFSDSTYLSKVANKYIKGRKQLIYTDLEYVDNLNQNTTRSWISGPFSKRKIIFGWHPPHPGTFITKSLLQTIGGFKLKYKIASDYDLMIRALEKIPNSEDICYISGISIKMREGGLSNRSLSSFARANLECFDANIRSRMWPFALLMFVCKPLSKLKQWKKLFGFVDSRLA